MRNGRNKPVSEMIIATNTKTIIIACMVILLFTITLLVLHYTFKQKGSNQATTAIDGELNSRPGDTAEEEADQEYYGSSTLGECSCGCHCVTDGCNGEICRSSKEESVITPCLLPDKPLPKDLGYSCRCVQAQCQWTK